MKDTKMDIMMNITTTNTTIKVLPVSKDIIRGTAE